MPAHAPAVTRETELYAGYITQQLLGVKAAGYGLTDEQLRATPTVSTLSVGALMKHVARCVSGWLDRVEVAQGLLPEPPALSEAEMYAAYGEEWSLENETGESLRTLLDEQIARVAAALPGYDLDAAVPVPHDAPWWPQDVDFWTVRWCLLHVVEEAARHAGHADIIRESVDRATMYELLGGMEGWPATDWFTPWQPKETV